MPEPLPDRPGEVYQDFDTGPGSSTLLTDSPFGVYQEAADDVSRTEGAVSTLKVRKPMQIGFWLAIGWIVVIPAPIILPQLGGLQLATLVGGGLAYSVGAVVYALKWPDPYPLRFGFHEIWHVFVLAGAGAHFAFMVTLLPIAVPAF